MTRATTKKEIFRKNLQTFIKNTNSASFKNQKASTYGACSRDSNIKRRQMFFPR